jgi:hypothetical protein
VTLSTAQGNEYERDWSNIQVLGPDQLVVMWEGGWRAYRNAQYSEDGGATWSTPIDTYPWLIGENGTVEFAWDSNEVLHLFIAQRVREGSIGYGDDTNAAVWHSVWQGGRSWSEPLIVTPPVNLINPKAVITGGNRVAVTWYTQRDVEIMVMTGQIQDAPYVARPAWTKPADLTPIQENPTAADPTPEITLSPTATLYPVVQNQEPASFSEFSVLTIAIIPVFFLVVILIILFRNKR